MTAPLTVNHAGQLPAVNISFNLKPGAALGDGVDQIQQVARELGLPGTMAMTFQGTAQAFQDSLKNLGLLLLIAVVVIYLVLGMLYESFIHPITILSGLPSAGLGALATLIAFGAAAHPAGATIARRVRQLSQMASRSMVRRAPARVCLLFGMLGC